MADLKPVSARIDAGETGYFPVTNQNGELRCSCGRELIKEDESTYRCSFGWPRYSLDQGEVFKDKFGNLYLKTKDHGGQKNERRA